MSAVVSIEQSARNLAWSVIAVYNMNYQYHELIIILSAYNVIYQINKISKFIITLNIMKHMALSSETARLRKSDNVDVYNCFPNICITFF